MNNLELFETTRRLLSAPAKGQIDQLEAASILIDDDVTRFTINLKSTSLAADDLKENRKQIQRQLDEYDECIAYVTQMGTDLAATIAHYKHG